MDSSYLIILFVLIGCMLSTVPVFISLFFAAIVGASIFLPMAFNTSNVMLVNSFYKSMDNFTLIVAVLFILCGNIMTSGRMVNQFVKLGETLTGWLPGGMGMAGVLACGLFGAISGSTVATVVAIGGVMIPALSESKYEKKYSVGLMTASPNLGIIIPPSISMILYCMISDVSLEGLFLTGFLPGVLIIIGFSIYTYFYFKNNKEIVRRKPPSFGELIQVIRETIWTLMLPVIIFGTIYTGVCTANEAGALACLYAIAVEFIVYRDMTLKEFQKIVISSAVTSSTLLIIVAGATTFGRFLSMAGIPTMLTDAITEGIKSPMIFLLVLNFILLFVGMFIDVISATMILGPVLLPMAISFGVDPMHLGLILTLNLAIGYCTPPMGVSIYIAGSIANKDLIFVSRAVLPFVVIPWF